MLEIITKADKLVEKHNMLSFGDFVVVGVSGGADSMALLNYLMTKKDILSLRILVANVEHGIRGQESIEDTQFVKDYCNRNNIEFACLSIDAVNESKALGLSVEEYSRNRRYEFFNFFNPDKIATAHNLSDNVETVLFRVARGTSIKGLCGIPPVRDNIIRPLLNCSSQEIRNALDNYNIAYRVDSTNSDNEYSRNRIRNCIVAQFKEINSAFEQNANRLIDSASEDEEFLSSYSYKAYQDCFINNELIISKLIEQPRAIAKRIIIRYCLDNNISLDELHLDGIYSLLSRNGKYQIKDDLFLVSNEKTLRIAKFDNDFDFSSLKLEKNVVTKDEYLNNCELLSKQFDFYCDYDKIIGKLIFRQRRAGDTISPVNRNCTKSIKKLYNELGINIEQREKIPLLCDDTGVIGVYGYCVDERVRVDENTKNVVYIKISLEDNN